MKKIVLLILLCNFISYAYGQSSTNVTYVPDPASPTAPTRPAAYPPGVTPPWYVNLEKYWFYRYRLVNDFLVLGNFAGGSIPAQQRVQGDVPSGYIPSVLKWADAPIDLGHYLGALACEWQLLNNNHYSTHRTEVEIQYALNAFDRLDNNAEQYCYNVISHTATGYPGMIVPYANFSYSESHNGFFIRDDVPWTTITNSALFPTSLPLPSYYLNFNRSGLTPNQQVVNGDGSFNGRYQGLDPDLPCSSGFIIRKHMGGDL